MAIPVEKLPALLRTPFLIPSISKLRFVYPYHAFGGNNVRYFYKQKAPLIKYYNPQTKLELSFQPNEAPRIEVFKGEAKVSELTNELSVEQILQTLADLEHSGSN